MPSRQPRRGPAQLQALAATQAGIAADAALIGAMGGGEFDPQITAARDALAGLVSASGLTTQQIEITGSQPIQVKVDSNEVYKALLELARRSGGTLQWTAR